MQSAERSIHPLASEPGPRRAGVPSPERPSRLDRALAWASRACATRRGYALVFFLLYSAVWVPVVFTCLVCGKSFIWQTDGLSQQYVWYVYVGQWLRELLSNVFVTHTFAVPLWDMSSGYGADVIQTVGGMLLNPLYWTSALLPGPLAEVGLELVTLVTLYGAGLAFSAWARGLGVGRGGALLGALAYAFSGFTVVLFTQPSFIVTLAVFPLVLWAADRVFSRKSPLPFVLVLAWCLASSFYDAYMICILLVGYCLLRFFTGVDAGMPRRGRLARLARWVALFVLLVALAALLSCVLLLPQVLCLSGSSRLGLERSDGLLYDLSWYAGLLTGLLSYDSMGSDAYVGLNAVAPVALVLLVSRRRSHRGLLVALCVLSVMLVVPLFGRVMNGMQYPSNRWSWAFALCVAYVVARLLPEAATMTRAERRASAAALAIYAALVLVVPFPGRSMTLFVSLSVALAVLAVALTARLWPRPRLMAALACGAMLSGVVTLTCYLSPYFGNWATQLMGVGKSWQFHSSNAAQKFVDQARASGVDYDETYRYDRTTPVAATTHNSGMVTGLLGTDYYNSIYNQGVDDLNTSLGLVDTEGTNFRHGSLNSRTMLEALLGVRYYYLDDQFSAMLPETFRDGTAIAEGPGREDHYTLYETDLVAPLAFSTSSYLTRAEYDALPMVDRQRALLAGVVLDDGDAAKGLTDVAGDVAAFADARDVAYEVADAHGVTVEGAAEGHRKHKGKDSLGTADVGEDDTDYDATGADPTDADDGAPSSTSEEGSVSAGDAASDAVTFTARYKGASVRLRFSSPADAETYLVASGLTYQDIPYRQRYTDEEWARLGFIGRLKVRIAEVFRTANTNGPIQVDAPGSRSTIYQMNADDHMYGGKHDWMVNLGYAADGSTTVVLTFMKPGVYSFDALRVVAQPMEGVDDQVRALAAAGAQDIELGTNEMRATSDSNEDGLLFWSVAYSQGWSATVDGEPARVHRADLGFMAVEVPAGTHEVVMTYRTPYLVQGAVLSLAGLAGTVALCAVRRRRERAASSDSPTAGSIAGSSDNAA